MSSHRDFDDKTEEITEKLKQSVVTIFSRYPVVSAYLYGSQVTGFTHAESDIDIAAYVMPDSELELNQELSLGRELEQNSGLKPIELRVINDLPLTIQDEILTTGILIYSADETERVDFETKTTALYFDYQPYIEYFRNTFLESVKKRGIM